jgi:DNA polymerase-3 subunit epsilon/ATP-dependent DNA helicase DinG
MLKALVLARLPFHVPSDPIFAARSAQYEDPFFQYALPQAVLRFRQGIGRLIRSSQDRGNIVVLDKRIIARTYGKTFLNSIPPCTVKLGPLSSIPGYAAEWIE